VGELNRDLRSVEYPQSGSRLNPPHQPGLGDDLRLNTERLFTALASEEDDLDDLSKQRLRLPDLVALTDMAEDSDVTTDSDIKLSACPF